jgi:hypothetical protein
MVQNEYPAHEGLQVVPTDGLEAQAAGIQPDIVNKEKIVGSPPPVYQKGYPTVCGIKRRTFGIVAAIVIALVVVGAVVGGVLGSKAKHSSSNNE